MTKTVLVILLSAMIVAGGIISFKYGIVSVWDLSFTLGLFVAAPIITLRDVIQENKVRVQGFIGTLLAFFILLQYTDDTLWASAVAVAVTWTLLFDGILYTWFRRFGWVPAMIVSDCVAQAMSPIFFYYLYEGGWAVPDGQILLRYLTLFAVYGIILSTGWLDRFMKVPRFIDVPREKWFKYYD